MAKESKERAARSDELQEMDKPQRRRRVVSAGDCPRAAHGPGRVYKTNNRVRYCVCDQCGETWTKAGPPATEEDDE